MNFSLKKTFILAVITLSIPFISGCKKYVDYSDLVVKVKKSNGVPVSGANIKITSLQAQNTPGVQMAEHLPVMATTDGSGQATMQIKYEGVLDILVTSSQGDTTDFVKLKIGDKTEKKITLR